MNTEKKINVIVETIDNEEVTITVNTENKVEHLIKDAFKELSIDPGNEKYELKYNGITLEPDKKIEHYSIPNLARVLLRRVAKVG